MVQDGVTTSYTYDALGQLIRVVDGQEGATWEYEYDQGGNILSKKKYVSGALAESKTFTYGNANWRDQLTAVDGVPITYYAIGNPLNDGTWTYTWQNGRQLARMQKDGMDASYVYNENGLRVQKTVNGVVTKYTLHGKSVVHMTQGNDELHFYYDASGKPVIVVYNGVPYSYVKNLQGDIVAILDTAGNVVVSYVYDAWGRPISKTGGMAATLGTVQPFRYRGYVYDEEIQLYYLRFRFFNSNWNRLLNADCLVQHSILGSDMFAYCRNCPVNRSDSSGCEDMPVVPTPAPPTQVTPMPTPYPSRPDNWYYEFRMAEQQRVFIERINRIVEGINDIALYVEAQQILEEGVGQIGTKSGYTLGFVSTARFNEWYRRDSASSGLSSWLQDGAMSGLGELAERSSKFARFAKPLKVLSLIMFVRDGAQVMGDMYVNHFLEQPGCIGLVYVIGGKEVRFCYGWDEHTIEKTFGDIDWVKPGSWSLGD
ncbi:MAG: hypothetical protein IKK57_05610 [Clostridia bacterium]|nr:hypothetical protein [Clostridia bacterium]